jgi:hypothetical protein
MAVRQVISCTWQDEQGDPLAGGRIVFEASGDAVVTGTGELCAGIKGSLTLDTNGQVAASPAQYMWPTDQMNPSNITYTVWVYNANGQLAWGPNYGLTVPSGAGSFNLCTWVPNQIGSGTGASAGSLVLQTNGVNNGSQQLLDLQEGKGITLVDNGSGQVTIASSGGNGPRTRGWSGWVTDGADGPTPGTGQGCTPNFSLAGGASYTGVAPTATETKMLKMNTSASSSSISGFTDNGDSHTADSVWTLGILGICEHRVLISSLTHIRVWIGGENGYKSGANFWKSDAPPEPTVAFRYSTAASDVNWQCVVTDGTTQVVADSGIPADTVGHVFAIAFSTPNVLFFIDGTQVGSVAISTTTLSTSSAFSGFVSVDNVSSANDRSFSIAYSYWDTTP